MGNPSGIHLPGNGGISCGSHLFRNIVAAETRFPVTIELLPYSTSRPTWNGSCPYLVSQLVDGKFRKEWSGAVLPIGPALHHEGLVNAFEVDLHSGRFILRQTDLLTAGTIPLSLTRTYSTWDSRRRAFGVGASHPYDVYPTGTRFPYTFMDLNLEDGWQVPFPRISRGTWYEDAVYRHSDTASEFYGSQISWRGDTWSLKLADGDEYIFPEAYHAKNFEQCALVAVSHTTGGRVDLSRAPSGHRIRATSSSGYALLFTYDDSGRIVEANNEVGETRKYAYDPTGHLLSISDGSHEIFRFEYQFFPEPAAYDSYFMISVTNGDGKQLLHNDYTARSHGRLSPTARFINTNTF
jgi:YD repeat-containing protein